jgi:hypothetical protein
VGIALIQVIASEALYSCRASFDRHGFCETVLGLLKNTGNTLIASGPRLDCSVTGTWISSRFEPSSTEAEHGLNQ